MGKSLKGKELGKGISNVKMGFIRHALSIVLAKDRRFMQKIQRYNKKAAGRTI